MSTEPPVRIVGAGIDSLYLSYRFRLAKGAEEMLERQKLAAGHGPRETVHPVTGEVLYTAPREYVMAGGSRFEVMGYGAQSAPFLLHNADVHVAINPRGETAPTMQVQVLSSALWREGPEALVAAADDIAIALSADGELAERFVSRVDLCVDHQGWIPQRLDFDRFVSIGRSRMTPFVSDDVVKPNLDPHLTQLERRMWYRTKLEGFKFGGSGRVVCRWYDKTVEIRNTGKEWFIRLWDQSGQLQPGAAVWRLEFQFNREFFREGLISGEAFDSVESVLAQLPALWSYATQHWLRLTEYDRERRSDSTVTPEWQALSECPFKGSRPRIAHEVQLRAEAWAKVPAFRGYAAAWGALDGHTTLEDVAASMVGAIRAHDHDKGKSFEDDLQRQRHRYGVRRTDGESQQSDSDWQLGRSSGGAVHGRRNRRYAPQARDKRKVEGQAGGDPRTH